MKTIKYLGLEIPLDDEKVWNWLCEAKNLKGIFQMETQAAASTLKRIQPKNVVDLAVCSALNRPGALRFTDEIGAIRRGEKAVAYPHPRLEEILKETAGKYIFQEQLLQTATRFAGYEPKESAKYLKILGKKQPEELKKQESTFTNGMVKNGFEKEFAEKLFEELKGFANYGFNRCIFHREKIELKNGKTKILKNVCIGDKIKSYNISSGKNNFVKIKNIYKNIKDIYFVKLEDGKKIKCSLEHKFLCSDMKMRRLKEIIKYDFRVVTED